MSDEDTLLTSQNNTDAADASGSDDSNTGADDASNNAADDVAGDADTGQDDKQGDGKPADSADGDDKDSDADKGEGAPETYEDFTLPEGMEVNEALMDGFKPLAKELNLTQDQAQKLVDMQSELAQSEAEAQRDAFVETTEGWLTELKNDKDFGGVNYDKNAGVAANAVKEFGSPELMEALEETGMGNHPELVKAFYKVGKAMSEDSFRPSNEDGADDKKSRQDILFDKKKES